MSRLSRFIHFYTDEDDGNGREEPFVLKTVKSALVHITDALAKPAVSVKAYVEPVQDLHGYDAPYPAGGGKNKYPIAIGEDNFVDNGPATHSNSNGSLVIATSASGPASGVYLNSTAEIKKVFDALSAPFTVSFDIVATASGSVRFIACGVGANFTDTVGTTKVRLSRTVTDKSTINFNIYGVNNGATLTVSNLQIEAGSTATSWSPYSNICPITGHTGANVVRTGKNLFDKTQYSNIITGHDYISDSSYACKIIQLSPNTTYTVSQGSGVAQTAPILLLHNKPRVNENGYFDFRKENDVKTFITDSTGQLYIGAVNSNDSACYDRINACNVQIELGSTATTYEPYSGTTIPITFPSSAGTVYGCEIDVTGGKLVVTQELYNAKSASWETAQLSGHQYFCAIKAKLKESGYRTTLMCNMFKPVVSQYAVDTDDCVIANFYARYYNINVRYDACATLADWNAFIANNDVFIAWALSTPIEYDLTPQQIQMLLGENNVWCDATGSEVELTYKASAS